MKIKGNDNGQLRNITIRPLVICQSYEKTNLSIFNRCTERNGSEQKFKVSSVIDRMFWNAMMLLPIGAIECISGQHTQITINRKPVTENPNVREDAEAQAETVDAEKSNLNGDAVPVRRGRIRYRGR